MKKPATKRKATAQVDRDDILTEYDFGAARPNKYAARYAAGCSIVVLDADVAALFPTADEVNSALRALGGIIQRSRPRRPTAALSKKGKKNQAARSA